MPVPTYVFREAASGDKKACALVEKEYGVPDGKAYAIKYLTGESPVDGFRSNDMYIEEEMSEDDDIDAGLVILVSNEDDSVEEEITEQDLLQMLLKRRK